ncbi:hypothetical protein EV1_042445 [Malus domestica]
MSQQQRPPYRKTGTLTNHRRRERERERERESRSDRSKPRNPKSRIRIPFSGKSHGGASRLAEFDAKKTFQFFHAVVVRRAASGRGASHHTQPGFGA